MAEEKATGAVSTGTFRFSGRDIVKHRGIGHHKNMVLIEAMTADETRLKMLCVAPRKSYAETTAEKLRLAKSLKRIDAIFSKMRAVILQAEKGDKFTIEVFGNEGYIPESLSEAIANGVETSVLPDRLDETTGKKFELPWNSDHVKRSKCAGMIRSMDWAFPEGGLPEDPDEFNAYYEEVKAEYWKQRAAGTFLPTARQISFARSINSVTGHPFDFDMNTATREEVGDYISRYKKEWETKRAGAKK